LSARISGSAGEGRAGRPTSPLSGRSPGSASPPSLPSSGADKPSVPASSGGSSSRGTSRSCGIAQAPTRSRQVVPARPEPCLGYN
jgi:hypothetical protein